MSVLTGNMIYVEKKSFLSIPKKKSLLKGYLLKNT